MRPIRTSSLLDEGVRRIWRQLDGEVELPAPAEEVGASEHHELGFDGLRLTLRAGWLGISAVDLDAVVLPALRWAAATAKPQTDRLFTFTTENLRARLWEMTSGFEPCWTFDRRMASHLHQTHDIDVRGVLLECEHDSEDSMIDKTYFFIIGGAVAVAAVAWLVKVRMDARSQRPAGSNPTPATDHVAPPTPAGRGGSLVVRWKQSEAAVRPLVEARPSALSPAVAAASRKWMAVRYFADDAGLDAFLQQASPVTALGDVPGDHVFIGVLEDSTGELKPDRGGRIGMEHYDRLAALAASDEPPEFRLRHIALRDCEGFTGRG